MKDGLMFGKYKMGWKRQLPDFRDFKYTASPEVLKALPTLVDLRSSCPPVLNQGSLGSCTANAIGSDHWFEQLKQGEKDTFAPSRLFIYYNEREMEGTINDDAGAIIRDGMKTVAEQGVCSEDMWPYDTSKFTKKPSTDCYASALRHQVVSYNAVQQTLDQLKGCLAEGYPFVFGFSVYESFESQQVASTGYMPMPGQNESLLGGHAVMAVGYDDVKQVFIIRNSWGEGWGDKGYFYMPYAYITSNSLASDFWTIRLVEDESSDAPQPKPDPQPDNKSICDGLFSSAQAFVNAAVAQADKMKGIRDPDDRDPALLMIEAGLRGLQGHLEKLGKVRNRKNG